MKLLKCKICGYDAKQLHQHIKYKHNLSGDEYKKEYGVDKLQMVTKEQCKMRSEIALNGGSNRRVEYWLNRGYSLEDAKIQVGKIQSNNGKQQKGGGASTAFQYKWWMKKHNLTKEGAIQKVYEIQSKNSNKSKRYTGQKSTPERNRKISISMSNHISTVGKKEWVGHFGDFSEYYKSKPEIELFNYIKDNINENVECNVFIGNRNVDILYKNKIIEFFGDYWHCNPNKYDNDYFHKQINLLAEEIWDNDSDKINYLKSKNYDVLVVWEYDWNKNKQNEISEIKRFLND